MSHLGMEFLGGFRVTLDGVPITSFESNKVRALLAYLATESQRPHPREALAALLWPDWPDRAALSNLRYALSNLRKATGDREADPPFLIISREAIQFNTESDHSLDVAEFAELADGQNADGLEQAISRYNGEFLEGFSVGDAAPFEDWARLEGEQLHRTFLDTLHQLEEALELGGEVGRALSYARQGAAAEPLDERAQRQVMRLLALSGRGAEALAQYEACREVLKAELGAEPSGETTRLYEQILAGQMEAVKPAVRVATRSSVPAFLGAGNEFERPVFVARERELGQLSTFLEEALSGNGKMAFITGEPGQGKTALMQEFAHQAMKTHPDLLVASGNCNAYAGVGDPYLPFREIMDFLTGDVEARWASGTITQDHALRLWRSLPIFTQALLDRGASLIGGFVSGDGLLGRITVAAPDDAGLHRRLQKAVDQQAVISQDKEQSNLFEQFTNVLQVLAEVYPLLLILDDLQWADTATTSLLFHLGRRLAGRRILIIGAYRPEEVSLGREGEKHPLEKVLAEFKRQYGDIWVNLGRVGEAEHFKFVNDFLDTQPNQLPRDFRQALFHRTEGHPLFTIELLWALQERGDLVQNDQERWMVSATLIWDQLPDRVEAVIEERIGRLKEEPRELLAVASVEGEDFTAEVVAQVLEVNERLVLRQLSHELEKRHRLVREMDEVQADGKQLSRYRFSHHLFQHYLYNNLGAGERRLLHGQIAAVLEALYAHHPAGIAVKLAYHYGRAGNQEKELIYLSPAGRQALASYAHQEAEKYFRRALDIQVDVSKRADLLSGLGEAYFGQSRFAEAIRTWREGIELYQSLGPEGQSYMARLYARAAYAASQIGDWSRSLQFCEQGLAALAEAPESPEMALLLSEAGRSFIFNGYPDKAKLLCQQALAMAERLGALEVQADTLVTYGSLPCISPDEAAEALNQAVDIAEAAGSLEIAARAYKNLGGTKYDLGDVRGSFDQFLRSVELSRKIGAVHWELSSFKNLLTNALSRGELAYVEQRLPEYERLVYSLPDPTPGKLDSMRLKVNLFVRQGNLWEALHQAQELEVEIRDQYNDLFRLCHCYAWQGEIILELHRLGEPVNLAAAEDVLNKAIEISNQIGSFQVWTQFPLCIVYARQGRVKEASLLLDEAREFAESILDQAWLKYAQAELSFSKKCWDEAIEALDICSRLLTRIERRPMLAQALAQWADTHIARRGPTDLDSARTLLLKAQSIYEDMGSSNYLEFVKQKLKDLAEY